MDIVLFSRLKGSEGPWFSAVRVEPFRWSLQSGWAMSPNHLTKVNLVTSGVVLTYYRTLLSGPYTPSISLSPNAFGLGSEAKYTAYTQECLCIGCTRT